MRLFLAGSKNMLSKECLETEIKKGVYFLSSFINRDMDIKYIPLCKDFLLDSGAFTYMTSKKSLKIDWNSYIDKYADFILENQIKNFFELDIDKIVGYDKVKKLRQRLEAKTGKQSIAVLHNHRDLNECKALCKDYDYVALGGFVNKEIKKDSYKYVRAIINLAHENGAKIHGLGFTKLKYLDLFNFDSVDSTSWLSGTRYGGRIDTFRNNTIITKSYKTRYKDYQKLTEHNFRTWCQLMRYLDERKQQ